MNTIPSGSYPGSRGQSRAIENGSWYWNWVSILWNTSIAPCSFDLIVRNLGKVKHLAKGGNFDGLKGTEFQGFGFLVINVLVFWI